jgi:hypothetical protein
MSRDEIKPFLISKSPDGSFRLTIRDTHYNSLGYPIVKSSLHDEIFPTATAARAYARDNFGAKAGEYSKG